MPKVPLSSAKAGMILSKPVTNKNGMVLVKEGTELTDNLLDRLRGMNLDGVLVKGMTKPNIPKKDALLAIDRKFRMVQDQPIMSLLKKILKEHIEGLYE